MTRDLEVKTFLETDPISDLERTLSEADKAYYDLDDPVMSNGVYDELVQRYFELTGKRWMKSGVADPGLPHGRHSRPMQSLDKIHSTDEFKRFGLDALVIVTPKVDGGGLSLDYDVNGNLVRALTRGDHVTGEDVTEAARLIPGIPHQIPAGPRTIRGEIYLSDENFAIVGGKNPRNAATGTLRRKANLDKAKYLGFVAYKAFDTQKAPHDDTSFFTEQEMLTWLKEVGFEVPPYYYVKLRDLTEENLKAVTRGLPYWTDGAVITVNDWSIQRSLGLASKFPRYAVAYKFPVERVETPIRDIEWAATRTGRVVPTGIFDPVQLGGTTVSRATLHNLANVRDVLGGFGPGDIVEVLKANEIIPRIERVVTRFGDTFYHPLECPSCQSLLVVNDVDLVCTDPSCPPKLVELLKYACSRKNLYVDGMGDTLAEALADELVDSLADLFKLSLPELADLTYGKGTYGETRARKLLAEIEKAKQKSWAVVLHSLGCPGLGEPECAEIAKRFGLLELVENSRNPWLVEKLVALDGIGPKTAETLVGWLQANESWLTELALMSGLNVDASVQEEPQGTKLSGQTWVITGTLSVPRHVFESMITAEGGTVTGSVSKKTTALLAGDAAGSKLEKARKLGIPIHDEASFRALIG